MENKVYSLLNLIKTTADVLNWDMMSVKDKEMEKNGKYLEDVF